jgi:hypothetical protein
MGRGEIFITRNFIVASSPNILREIKSNLL